MKAKHSVLGIVEVVGFTPEKFSRLHNDMLLQVKTKKGATDFARRHSLIPLDEPTVVLVDGGLNEMGRQFNELAREKGWYEPGKEKTFLEDMMLVVSEISEAVEDYRAGLPLNETQYKFKTPADEVDGTPKPNGIPSELADAVIRILEVAYNHGIDMDKAVREKHEFNKTREYRHGGKRV